MLRYARDLSESLFANHQNNLDVAFLLTPYPAKGPAGEVVSEITLEMGGDRLRYRMGPQEQQEMHWPGKSGGQLTMLQAKRTILQAKAYGSWVPNKDFDFKGEWGFFHLLDRARVMSHRQDHRRFKIEWDMHTPKGERFIVRYDLIAHSIQNPFHKDFFKNFHCTQDLGSEA